MTPPPPPPPGPLVPAHHRSIVALGGGHGLSAALTALRLLTDSVTAVVTVADDGGSSGRLRDEFDVLPPGDLRMALSALCDDSDWGHTWRDVLQHRFSGTGDLAGHALGNLMIVSIWELLGDTVKDSTSSAGCSAPGVACCRWRGSRCRSSPRSEGTTPSSPT